MRKKRIFRLGSCVVQDAFFHFRKLFKEFGYEVVNTTYDRVTTPAFSSLLDEPGPLAERLYDEMHKTYLRNMQKNILNNNWGTDHFATWVQYQSIVKQNTPDTLFTDIGPEDILLLDFHGELYSRYDDGKDSFGIWPFWPIHTRFFPQWFVDKVNTFPTYQSDMISREQIKKRHQKMMAFGNLLQKKFNNNIIVLDSVFTTRLYIEGIGTGKQLEFEHLNLGIPFITVDQN